MYSELLELSIAKRIGGRINITGIYYQMLYACLAILKNYRTVTLSINLEGIERY